MLNVLLGMNRDWFIFVVVENVDFRENWIFGMRKMGVGGIKNTFLMYLFNCWGGGRVMERRYIVGKLVFFLPNRCHKISSHQKSFRQNRHIEINIWLKELAVIYCIRGQTNTNECCFSYLHANVKNRFPLHGFFWDALLNLHEWKNMMKAAKMSTNVSKSILFAHWKNDTVQPNTRSHNKKRSALGVASGTFLHWPNQSWDLNAKEHDCIYLLCLF